MDPDSDSDTEDVVSKRKTGFAVHICRFDSADHLTGKQRTYESVKSAVIAAGRYSVFEATSSKKNAAIFNAIDRDPELIVERAGFPWTNVRRRLTMAVEGELMKQTAEPAT